MPHICQATTRTCKHQRRQERQRRFLLLLGVFLIIFFTLVAIYGHINRAEGHEKIRPFISPVPEVAGQSAQFKDILIPQGVLYVSPLGEAAPSPTPPPVGTRWEIQGNTDIKDIIASDKTWVANIVVNAARKYGVSETLMLAIAKCESGFRPTAKAKTSSATGVFQFIRGTWLGYVKQRGLDWTLEDREDAEKNADMTAYILARGGLHNWEADPRSEACWGWARNK